MAVSALPCLRLGAYSSAGERRRRSSRQQAPSAVTSLSLWRSSRRSRKRTPASHRSSRYQGVCHLELKKEGSKCYTDKWNIPHLAVGRDSGHSFTFTHLPSLSHTRFYFIAFQEAESNRLCRRLQLKDIIPIEMLRLTKYPLLLDNIAKYTGTEELHIWMRDRPSTL